MIALFPLMKMKLSCYPSIAFLKSVSIFETDCEGYQQDQSDAISECSEESPVQGNHLPYNVEYKNL